MTDTKNLKYTKTHEWIKQDGTTCTVGITDFAQKEMGDIVYVELPKIGKELTQGAVAGTIESVKAAFEIYAPISGKVIAANDKVTKDIAIISTDPYGEGWLYKLDPKKPEELNSLMDEAAYAKITAEAKH
ncbi:MAG: glycine cleavage system protein GcvH [Elusimicrobia bacterium]|nr:glycine cleavage system protein GcvH [Elusimicrobiota bacterium]